MNNVINEKDISVVIPLFNSKDTILRALDSIKNQTNFGKILEVIIVNDGSTDNSIKVVEDYELANRDMPLVLINQANGGVSKARNRGMEIAKGKWIALLDADDEWLPRKIEIQMDLIRSNPAIDFIGGDINDKGLKILFKRIRGLYKAEVKDVCLKNFPQTSAALFRKEIFEKIGGYDEDQKYAEDGNYFLKICTHFNYFHLPVQLVCYDGGKPGFGFSGLSANMHEMYIGNLKNIRELKEKQVISTSFYMFLRVFYGAKYIRRILMSKLRLI